MTVFVLLLAGCRSGSEEYKAFFADPIRFSRTVHELNTVVMGNNFPPIVASRNYAYASIAAYEAMAAGHSGDYNSLSGQIKHLPVMPQAGDKENTNYNLAALLAFVKVGESVTFPEGSMSLYLDSLMEMGRDLGLPKDVEVASTVFADSIAATIIRWAKEDGYSKTRGAPKYTVVDTPGRWMPTPPMYGDAMEPHWAQIRPLVMDSASMFTPPPPIPFDIADRNSAYYKEIMAVKNARETLTKEQEHMAVFWDDNPLKLNVSGHVMFSTKKFSPPGHWMNIVGIAAMKDSADLPKTIAAYAATSIAFFDAFIQSWDEKFRSNMVRPETVINKYIDPNWTPLLQTPPFPEYTCGHSTCSSAAAEVLTDIFGENFAYTDTSELEFGIPSRSYTSFRHAAEENNWARFFGGIHLHSSCIVSTEYGTKVGDLVVERLKLRKR